MSSRVLALALLLPATLGQQIWYVSRAVLPAQDAVDYVSVAQRIDREGFSATVRTEPVPPLFPAAICASRHLLVAAGRIEPREWGAAAQWAAAAALVLAVIPAYALARRVVDPLSAFCGTLLLVSLPETARLGADGTSDALHLLCAATALWGITAAIDPASVRRLGLGLLAGACAGAALLVRSEMLVVAAVFVLAGLASSMIRSNPERPQRRNVALAFALGLLVAPATLFVAGIREPAELATRLRGGGAPTEDLPLNADVAPLHMSPFRADATLGKKDPTQSIRFHGLTATLVEFAREFAQASAYVFLPLALYGAWSVRKRHGSWRACDRFTAAAVVALSLVIFAVAWRGGYLSSRHFLLPLLLSLPYAGLGVAALTQITVEALAARTGGGRDWEPDVRGYVTVVAAFAVVQSCLYAAREPAHRSQQAHREAAAWLQSADALPGAVLDQQGFTGLVTGRPTYRFEAAEQAFADPRLAYVLLERADLERASPRADRLRQLLGDANYAVARFADDRRRPEREVLIFGRPSSVAWSDRSQNLTAHQEAPRHAR